jgi:hypothetical protein
MDYYKLGEPYHGYCIEILIKQGANPPGGA